MKFFTKKTLIFFIISLIFFNSKTSLKSAPLKDANLDNLDKTNQKNFLKPYFIKTNNDPVCNVVMDHYMNIFSSKSLQVKDILNDPSISYPKYNPIAGSNEYKYKYAHIIIEKTLKVFVFEMKWLRNKQTNKGHLINPCQFEQLKNRISNIRKFIHFLPPATEFNNFSWCHDDMPFQYNKEWYYIYKYADHTPQRSVQKITKYGTSHEVCRIQLFHNLDETKSWSKQLPFFSVYTDTVDKIADDYTYECPRIFNSGYHKNHAREVIRILLTRPWVWDLNKVSSWDEYQKKHFNHWKYKDIWNYRQFGIYQNSFLDAVNELKEHYIKNFSYSEKIAFQYASKAIEIFPSVYYALGKDSYTLTDNDFIPFQQMLDGEYNNWSNIIKYLSYHGEKYNQMIELTLMIDNPALYNELPQKIESHSMKYFYNKDLLMVAAHMNNFETVKYLVDSGWSVKNVTNANNNHYDICSDNYIKYTNRSALTYAAENASIELIKYLVKAGADTKILDSLKHNLDYYIQKNPRFSEDEKKLGFEGILKVYSKTEKIKPSFNCQGKLNVIEKTICQSETLSIYDRELGIFYKDLIKEKQIADTIKSSQIKWIKMRNKKCFHFAEKPNQLKACLAINLRARVKYLEHLKTIFNKF